MICPNCNTIININCKESTHQVNDNNGFTYCSYECSAVGTLEYLRTNFVDQDLNVNFEHLDEILLNT